jgi:predicted  nucleic acid-binding Zn-ribbon protein
MMPSLLGERASCLEGKKRMEAYCVKCREKREMVDGQEVVMKNGKKAMQGKCPTCGTKLFRSWEKPRTQTCHTGSDADRPG